MTFKSKENLIKKYTIAVLSLATIIYFVINYLSYSSVMEERDLAVSEKKAKELRLKIKLKKLKKYQSIED